MVCVFVDCDQPVKFSGMFEEHSLHCSLFEGMWSDPVVSNGVWLIFMNLIFPRTFYLSIFSWFWRFTNAEMGYIRINKTKSNIFFKFCNLILLLGIVELLPLKLKTKGNFPPYLNLCILNLANRSRRVIK